MLQFFKLMFTFHSQKEYNSEVRHIARPLHYGLACSTKTSIRNVHLIEWQSFVEQVDRFSCLWVQRIQCRDTE